MKKALAFILVLAMALSLVACGKKDVAPDGTGSAGEGAVREDLVLQLNAEPTTLDYQQDTSVITQVLCHNLYSTLVVIGENGKIEGDLAESWEWNEDYTQITFKLREGIKFSDGSEITADDVIYSVKRGKDMGYSSWFTYVEDVYSPEAGVVVFDLTMPYTVFLNVVALTFFAVMPEGSEDISKTATVTSGAYYLDQWNTGSSLVLKANPYYWSGEAPIKEVEIVFISDENSALIALETGDIDIMTGASSLSASSIEHVETLDTCKLVPNLKVSYGFLSLNQGKPELADVNVRRAINAAVDRQALIDVSVKQSGKPAGCIPCTEGTSGYLPGYENNERDVAKAKEYMAASNYPDGFTLVLKSGSPAWTKIATVIQSNLKEIGITVEIQESDTPTVIADMSSGNYEACIMTWGNANGDVTNLLAMYEVGNTMQFSRCPDPTVGELLTKSLTVEGAERDKVLAEAYELLGEQVPYVGLYWGTGFYGVNSELTIDAPIALHGYVLRSMHWD